MLSPPWIAPYAKCGRLIVGHPHVFACLTPGILLGLAADVGSLFSPLFVLSYRRASDLLRERLAGRGHTSRTGGRGQNLIQGLVNERDAEAQRAKAVQPSRAKR